MLNGHIKGGNKGSDFPLAGKNSHRTSFQKHWDQKEFVLKHGCGIPRFILVETFSTSKTWWRFYVFHIDIQTYPLDRPIYLQNIYI